MTYFGFLIRFLVVPIVILGTLSTYELVRARRSPRQKRTQPARWQDWRGWAAILLHVLVALLYTTPWDNYLVATRVWWYDPELVTGVTWGWVPLEEYTFFVLQTLMVGLALLLLARRLVPAATDQRFLLRQMRLVAPLLAMGVWMGAVAILVTGWAPGNYLALELGWALPPIALQLAYGADILWLYRRPIALAIVPFTLYLALADTLAIGFGTWTINPQQSVGLLIGGVLPVEELLFFLLTNTLVVFGVTLVLAPESLERMHGIARRWSEFSRSVSTSAGRSCDRDEMV